ncbi:MAG: Crp/Fnr family transcriptional regulator [Clostridia bacterium]|jgi:CRP-like cAMP-binding protein|nr:Crp/Fnr family transcriptional regulator [Clostridia bacterium]MBQ7727689.1 Crp/Fnr family transcriptional regulator [Clostridia bacterium]
MRTKQLDVTKHKLFEGADRQNLRVLFSSNDSELNTYPGGAVIYSPKDRSHKLGIVMKGRALLYSADESRNVVLSTIETGDVFGIDNLFSEEPFGYRVISKGESQILFISEASLQKILENDRAVAFNYIKLLSEKLRRLNGNIQNVTGGTAERRLALYLLDLGPGDDVQLTVPMSTLCKMLDIGRASLYRAMDQLSEDGLIVREGKNIHFTNRAELSVHYD